MNPTYLMTFDFPSGTPAPDMATAVNIFLDTVPDDMVLSVNTYFAASFHFYVIVLQRA